ncbi:MAG: sulfatase-like hydrolase/transferase [Pseudomonadota bacterium]|nr:sulfatase-like hydrolase/transferase [Pseudomonadota bacterium]
MSRPPARPPARLSVAVALAIFGCTADDKPADTRPGSDSEEHTGVDSVDTHTGDTTAPPPTYNVIVVLADDQAYSTMWAMPVTNARLLPEAIDFNRAYVTVPMCCPMRASFLSGGWYPRDTGVLTNGAPMGGASAFADVDSIGTRLQEAGVSTAMIGKYLNDYEYELAPYVAPGWDTWVASGAGDGAYDQSVVLGSSGPTASTVGTHMDTGGEHLTSYFFGQALDFVNAHADEPFFLYLAPNSPHLSGAPATEDLSLYSGFTARPPSWNEADVSDKPVWLQNQPPLSDVAAASVDENQRVMLRNLASFDREVGTFLDALAASGVLDRTVFIYTSDNGYLYGEHRLALKGLPYEESVHVPLYVRFPGVAGRVDPRLVAVNVDLAATVLELLGVPPTGEGLPLGSALVDPTLPTRDHVYMDNYTTGAPVWAGVVTERSKYIQWGTGETEVYDVVADPYELASQHASPPADLDLAALGTILDEHRGLAVLSELLDPAAVGTPYLAQLAHWGGTEPVIYSLDGTLPPGLTLGGGGLIQGMPTEAGEWVFAVWARDASISPWNSRSQAFSRALRITVGDAPPEAMLTRTEDTARVVLHTRPGVSVQVRATPEPVPEGMRRVSDTVVAGADGKAAVTLAGLRTDRDWYWVAYYDGIPGAHGEIPAPTVR